MSCCIGPAERLAQLLGRIAVGGGVLHQPCYVLADFGTEQFGLLFAQGLRANGFRDADSLTPERQGLSIEDAVGNV